MAEITIKPLNLKTIQLTLVGTSPFVQLRFSEKSRNQMEENMKAAPGARKRGKNRGARDFDSEFEDAMYRFENGDRGLPASSFRNAIINACRLTGYPMTKMKMSCFILADGYDEKDPSIPLVKIEGKPEVIRGPVRNANGGTDLRTRAMWRKWRVVVTARFDADQFTKEDIVNLFYRAGQQVGVGEGRPFSTNSPGVGWGTFTIESVSSMKEEPEKEQAA